MIFLDSKLSAGNGVAKGHNALESTSSNHSSMTAVESIDEEASAMEMTTSKVRISYQGVYSRQGFYNPCSRIIIFNSIYTFIIIFKMMSGNVWLFTQQFRGNEHNVGNREEKL